MDKSDLIPKTNLIKDYLLGYTTINQNVTLMNYGNVIVRKDYMAMDGVRIIAGSCSGEELGYAGFVGKGMLTAAMLGKIFVSTYSRQILQTIRELSLTQNCEILALVQAKSSDFFNFSLAVERAKNDRIRIKLLTIDDCYSNKSTNLQNVCGIIILIKLAGALAENGKKLEEIYQFCNKYSQLIKSTSWNLENTTHNHKKCYCRQINLNTEIEIGSKRYQFLRENIAELILDNFFELTKTSPADYRNNAVIILINVHRNVRELEELFLVRKIVNYLKQLEITNIIRLYSSHYLAPTSHKSLSLTVMKVDDEDLKIVDYLDFPTSATAWKQVNQTISLIKDENECESHLVKRNRLSPPIRGPILSPAATNALLLSLQFACTALISCEKQLNIIDSERSKGNMGSRIKDTCEEISKKMANKKFVFDRPFTFFQSLSKIAEKHIGGTMGSVYGVLFEAVANSFSEISETELVTPIMWLEAIKNATKCVKNNCNVDVGEKTIYDPLKAFKIVINEVFLENDDFLYCLDIGVRTIEETAQKTKENDWKYSDIGAHVLGIWMRAVFEGIKYLESE